ncbi:hypothetical protein KSP39_PZI003820 [Platanthera zijinensis]|uniref:Reverse transcriptase Ty1/copia-type domain-containing protein n=1 Tax=Platanthera zijinensis TaxID=2320716 RepID=A0AAP0BYX8_9ASPA
MALPPGLSPRGSEGKMCKLKKVVYGLKQSPRAWFGRFHKAKTGFGFSQSNEDHTLFIKNNEGKLTALIVYIDDIIITGDDQNEIQTLKARLTKEFEVKDLENLKCFLGIEVARSKHGIFISQRKYTPDLLEDSGMSGCRLADTPIEVNHRLGKMMVSPKKGEAEKEPSNEGEINQSPSPRLWVESPLPSSPLEDKDDSHSSNDVNGIFHFIFLLPLQYLREY